MRKLWYWADKALMFLLWIGAFVVLMEMLRS